MYVTHDQVEAMTMGDRVAVLRYGVLQQVATPSELFWNPANMFVASFVGAPPMNLFDVSLERKGDVLSAHLGAHSISLSRGTPAFSTLAGYGSDRVIAGIRPEHLEIVSPSPIKHISLAPCSQSNNWEPRSSVTSTSGRTDRRSARRPSRRTSGRHSGR